ncbi:MAG: hypothetical protein R6U96_11640 [Promethearchaeia archaeon]
MVILKTIQNKIKNDMFVGPKALFDPNFVPPKLLYRKKEEKALGTLLNDSLLDDFSINILYQGISGIGKKSLIIKVIDELFLRKNRNPDLSVININCLNKTIEEVLYSLLIDVNKKFPCNIDVNRYLNSELTSLWTTFKLALRKHDNDVLIIFTNIDGLSEKTFRKILQYGKEAKIPILSTVNKILQTSTLDLLQDFDLKNKLDYFSYDQLNKILKQRCDLAFPSSLDNELIEFLTDLIFEYYVPVPGKGIDLLKRLYPYLNERKTYTPTDILRISKTQLDTFFSPDELNLLSFLSERDILMLLFLDNLSNHFKYCSSFYITLKELRELYLLSAESIEYSFNKNEFHNALNMLQNIGILSLSKNRTPSSPKFFITIDKDQLKRILDASFSNPTFSPS